MSKLLGFFQSKSSDHAVKVPVHLNEGIKHYGNSSSSLTKAFNASYEIGANTYNAGKYVYENGSKFLLGAAGITVAASLVAPSVIPVISTAAFYAITTSPVKTLGIVGLAGLIGSPKATKDLAVNSFDAAKEALVGTKEVLNAGFEAAETGILFGKEIVDGATPYVAPVVNKGYEAASYAPSLLSKVGSFFTTASSYFHTASKESVANDTVIEEVAQTNESSPMVEETKDLTVVGNVDTTSSDV